MQRREFLQSAAAWTAIPLLGQSNTRYRTALIGAGSRGRDVLRNAMEAGRTKVVALCDVDENQLAPAAAEVSTCTGDRPARYRDYREMLAKEKPEICIIATPDHWHALTTIASVQAGAHVWLESPLCHTINEGRAMVKAARDADVVVQVGAQRHNASGLTFLRSGRLGRINQIRVCTSSSVNVAGILPGAVVPKGLDWDMWCGPASLLPYHPSLHSGGFRRRLEFANGSGGYEAANCFHEVLAWSEEKSPTKVFSVGTRHGSDDDSNGPDTQVSTFEFRNFTTVWEHRSYGGSSGVYYYGTEGTLHTAGDHGWTFNPAARGEGSVHADGRRVPATERGWNGFLASIEGTKRTSSDIEGAQRSTNMSLLAMISMNLGRRVIWDGVKMEIPGDPEANALLARPYRQPWDYPKA
ncbi:MAG: Gfo/Idh/MocA family oxidoreductase [Bryobacteraceae bacterium]